MFGHKLSIRLFNSLVKYGNKTTKKQVLESYIAGTLSKLRNFGLVCHNEVFDWLYKEILNQKKEVIEQKISKMTDELNQLVSGQDNKKEWDFRQNSLQPKALRNRLKLNTPKQTQIK